MLAFSRRGQDNSKQAAIELHLSPCTSGDLPRNPSGWGTGLSLTSLGRMRATQEELDGELMRWVALDPATISPAAAEPEHPHHFHFLLDQRATWPSCEPEHPTSFKYEAALSRPLEALVWSKTLPADRHDHHDAFLLPPVMIISSRLLLRRLRQRRRSIIALLLFLFTIDVILLLRHRPTTSRTTLPSLKRHGLRSSTTGELGGPGAAGNETFFIVSVHRNTGEMLPDWSAGVLALVDYLGPANVYFSALESGSQDDTKDKLTALKAQLDARRVPNTVTLGQTVWEQLDDMWARPDPDAPRQEGWIWNQEDKVYDKRRITYLARERNRAMEPMREAEERQGFAFDKVLWINDVIFDVEDFLTLLHTRGGSYAAACSMDYKHPPAYYDTFALRDDEGRKTASNHWPWFQGGPARDAALRSEPVRVASCWNGMVIFDAGPFRADPPLRFRAIPDALADLHLEGSECCLVHADNPLSAETGSGGGVWLNPNVRVGYSAAAYGAVRAREGERFPGALATVEGAWANRWLKWRAGLSHHFEGATISKRLRQWVADAPEGEVRREPGVSCLINEKQIMWMNGWRHL